METITNSGTIHRRLLRPVLITLALLSVIAVVLIARSIGTTDKPASAKPAPAAVFDGRTPDAIDRAPEVRTPGPIADTRTPDAIDRAPEVRTPGPIADTRTPDAIDRPATSSTTSP